MAPRSEHLVVRSLSFENFPNSELEVLRNAIPEQELREGIALSRMGRPTRRTACHEGRTERISLNLVMMLFILVARERWDMLCRLFEFTKKCLIYLFKNEEDDVDVSTVLAPYETEERMKDFERNMAAIGTTALLIGIVAIGSIML